MLQSIWGITLFIGTAVLFSKDRKRIPWKFVVIGLFLQFITAFLMLKISIVTKIFSVFNLLVILIQKATDKSAQFLFGYLSGGNPPFAVINSEKTFIVTFQILPLIVVVSALSALLYYWKIIPFIARLIGFSLKKTLNISGELALGSAATIFFGTIEAPILIRNYLNQMSKADLFALISCSMTTVSGTVMILYASVLQTVIPNPMVHLIVASIMSVPAALVLSRIIIPPIYSEKSQQKILWLKTPYTSSFDAITQGIHEGMSIIFGIVGSILVFFSFIYIINQLIYLIDPKLSLEIIAGHLLRPFLWGTGLSWQETYEAGKLMGTKIILNEFVAYLELTKVKDYFSPRSQIIISYALCGFANFGSAGIIIGGLSKILTERKEELISLTLLSIISGNLATLFTALIINIII